MHKLTNPWVFQKNADRRAEYAAEAVDRLRDYATRPISAVFLRSTESYAYYRVLGTTAEGRPVALASEIAGAAYDGKRVRVIGGDIVEGAQGWLVRVSRDGTNGAQHIRVILAHTLGGEHAEYDVTEF